MKSSSSAENEMIAPSAACGSPSSMPGPLVPQIPVYFISLPFVVAAGLVIFYFAVGTMLSLFADGFVDITIGR